MVMGWHSVLADDWGCAVAGGERENQRGGRRAIFYSFPLLCRGGGVGTGDGAARQAGACADWDTVARPAREGGSPPGHARWTAG